MDTKKKIIDIVSRVVLAVGIIVGIIFTAVGSMMIVNSGLKLTFFDEPRWGNLEWQLGECEVYGNTNRPRTSIDVEPTKIEEPTQEEIDACKENVVTQSKKEFLRGEQENIVNGFSSLFVGLLLWIAFGIWSKKSKKRSASVEENN